MTITDPLLPLLGTYAPEIVRAVTARQQLDIALHWMRQSAGTPNGHDRIARHSRLFWRTFWRAYHSALRDLVARVGVDALVIERKYQQDRLDKGWTVDGERSDRLFAEVVKVLEVLEDALRPQASPQSVSGYWDWRVRNAAGWLSDAQMVVQVSGVIEPAVDASEAIECSRAVIVCGSRDWFDDVPIWNALQSLHPATTVITGGASGADAIGHRIAVDRRMASRSIPANWSKHGRAAGPLRNTEMLELLLTFDERHVLAFRTRPDSRGTNNMIDQARRAGVAVTIIDVESPAVAQVG